MVAFAPLFTSERKYGTVLLLESVITMSPKLDWAWPWRYIEVPDEVPTPENKVKLKGWFGIDVDAEMLSCWR
jgi:hypothetical protein